MHFFKKNNATHEELYSVMSNFRLTHYTIRAPWGVQKLLGNHKSFKDSKKKPQGFLIRRISEGGDFYHRNFIRGALMSIFLFLKNLLTQYV